MLMLMTWPLLVEKIYPRKPVAPSRAGEPGQPGSALQGGGTNRLASGVPGGTNEAPTVPQISMPRTVTSAWVKPKEAEELITLDGDEARYIFTSHGGGLKQVELKGYPETVAPGRRHVGATNRVATLNGGAPVPALALFGGGALEDSGPFTLRKRDGGLRAERVQTNGLRIVKDFQLGSNHTIAVTVRVENQGKEPATLRDQELVIGTATPISGHDPGTYVRVEWFDGERTVAADQAWFANRPMGCGCGPGTPRWDYESPGHSNIVWASVQNQFFAMIAVPQTTAPQVFARRLDLPGPTADERAADSRLVQRPEGYQAALLYGTQVLAPGEAVERQLEVFAGPKEYNTLAKLGRNVDRVMGFTGFFGWFAKLLLLSMNGLHSFGLSYGLTIIAITVIIKALFWPLTQVSTRSMKRMQALQPQMKLLQEKYKDDPKKMNLKLMEFMKENKVSPLGGCLPILLQIPVFFGFFQMLRSAIELRGASFLWASDLSQPDTVAMVFGFPINPLPLIMGATQLWQARMTPPSPGMDPVQQKMMQYMPLIFVFMLYNFSAGLALYWTVQNLLSILQLKLTKTAGGPTPAVAAGPAAGPAGPRRRR
jgi:YidC/Oxa1 family membrane protein insertase